MSGALVIFVGAGIAMFLPISRWVEADERMQERQEGAGSDMGAQDETYSGRLRGGTGEYAIVEGIKCGYIDECAGARLGIVSARTGSCSPLIGSSGLRIMVDMGSPAIGTPSFGKKCKAKTALTRWHLSLLVPPPISLEIF